MNEIIQRIATCLERGKVNRDSPYPPDLKGEDGADELTRRALDEGVSAETVLAEGLIGMTRVGRKYSDGRPSPDLLMAAKAIKRQWRTSLFRFGQASSRHVCDWHRRAICDIGKISSP